jgi:hypothetical protein
MNDRLNKARAKYCRELAEWVLVATAVIKVLGFGYVLTWYILIYAGAFVAFSFTVWAVDKWSDRKERRQKRKEDKRWVLP